MKKPIILMLLAALLLVGCRQAKPSDSEKQPAEPESSESSEASESSVPEEPEPIDGGRTEKHDENAPKQIESKEITGLDASFYLANRWDRNENHFFHFQIRQDDDGVLTAYEENSGLHLPAEDALLVSLQEVIDRYDLVKDNGLYSVTAGLPPEYQESWLMVDYASGENLSFTVDNNPYAPWAVDFYTIFAEWFSMQGDSSLYPEKETSTVTRIKLAVRKDSLQYDYSLTHVPDDLAIDGETLLFCRSGYDYAKETSLSDDYILLPEDFYDHVTEIISATDLIRNYEFSYFDPDSLDYGNHDLGYYGMGPRPAGEADSETERVELYLEYESGYRLNIETMKPSEIEGLMPLMTELQTYCDSLF